MVAATMVGPGGKVVSIEMIPMMLKRARKNLEETSIKNITLEEASAEDLPIPGSSFDVVKKYFRYLYAIFFILNFRATLLDNFRDSDEIMT